MRKIRHTFKKHYTLYLIEAWGLGTFMLSACLFTILFQHPALGISHLIQSDFIRRIFIGIAMGLTAITIIYSPWGRKSGAQLNPSVTLTMLFIRKITFIDMCFYMIFQTLGGTIAVFLLKLLIPAFLSHPSINYVVTVPGDGGTALALLCECMISFILMFATLVSSNSQVVQLHRYTGIFSGILITIFVILEAPFSGMSMNPARTIASALPANIWTDCWIYFVGPPFSMLLAAYIYHSILYDGKLHTVKHYLTPKAKEVV
jgi:aquaporin Z